jgi:hypothetical protein
VAVSLPAPPSAQAAIEPEDQAALQRRRIGDGDTKSDVTVNQMEPAPTAVDFDNPEVHPDPQRHPDANVRSAHIKLLKDVTRDIDPDNDDYSDPPTDVGAVVSEASSDTGKMVTVEERQDAPADEVFWELGTVVHFNAMRCGKVRIQGVGDYPFDQRTLGGDFVPRVGMPVSCLLRERQGYFGGVQLLKVAPEGAA